MQGNEVVRCSLKIPFLVIVFQLKWALMLLYTVSLHRRRRQLFTRYFVRMFGSPTDKLSLQQVNFSSRGEARC